MESIARPVRVGVRVRVRVRVRVGVGWRWVPECARAASRLASARHTAAAPAPG